MIHVTIQIQELEYEKNLVLDGVFKYNLSTSYILG